MGKKISFHFVLNYLFHAAMSFILKRKNIIQSPHYFTNLKPIWECCISFLLGPLIVVENNLVVRESTLLKVKEELKKCFLSLCFKLFISRFHVIYFEKKKIQVRVHIILQIQQPDLKMLHQFSLGTSKFV